MAVKKPVIISIVGARPQFIKLAPLAKILSRNFRHYIVHTGQHYDDMMSDVFFRDLKLPSVDYELAVGSGGHGEMTGKIMMRLERLLLKVRPDFVLVYGDTNSTLAGALTAAKLHIPTGHVEAGLRSFDQEMPEEINRVLSDRISRLLFCPTLQAVRNLKAEGIGKGIVRSGDLMYELIELQRPRITANKKILKEYGLEEGRFGLVTIHRAGNVDNKVNLEKIIRIITAINWPLIFPVHPRTEKRLKQFGLFKILRACQQVIISQPLSYIDNLALVSGAGAVLTDSGGVQKESVYLGTPCLTLRSETEWVETLGWGNYLVGRSQRKIIRTLKNIKRPRRRMAYKVGGRKPSEIIVRALGDYFGVS